MLQDETAFACLLSSSVTCHGLLVDWSYMSYVHHTKLHIALCHQQRVNRVGNSLLLGHCPFGLEVTPIFKGTEASWEGTKATFHPNPRVPRPVLK